MLAEADRTMARMIATIMAIAALANQPLLLTNGKIWTGDASNRFVQAVAIDGGRIIAAGTNEDALRAAGTRARTIDLHGRLAVPGFIDNHVHFIDGGFELAGVQLRDAATPGEFARRIGAYAKTLPKGEWITGGGWDHQLWTPAQLPTRQMIDAVTPDNPVFVSRFDGHMALANSLALKLAGVTRDSKDPVGGTIVRDANGEPTGILKDARRRAGLGGHSVRNGGAAHAGCARRACRSRPERRDLVRRRFRRRGLRGLSRLPAPGEGRPAHRARLPVHADLAVRTPRRRRTWSAASAAIGCASAGSKALPTAPSAPTPRPSSIRSTMILRTAAC